MSRFLLALALLLAGCGQQADQPRTPRPAFRGMVTAWGNSMLPAFKDGETIGTEFCRVEDIGLGDTVIFWSEAVGTYVHHSIDHWDVKLGRWVTKGLANPGVDRGYVTSENFVCRTHKLVQVELPR
jgi:hypothetical protein